MTNPKIVVDALLNDDQFLREANKIQIQMDRLDTLSEKTGLSKGALTQALRNEANATQAATMSWTDFRSMYSTVLDVIRVGQAVWEETGQKYIDNAIKVGDMARSLGTTTEEASRLKEVADDVGISIQSLTTSFKQAQKDGFQPNIDGLARMSDEYLALAPGVERTQYLLDRFGKSGEEMGKLLDKGSAAIRANAAAIEESLIVTQRGYEESRKYQMSVDALSDSWDAFTYKVAPPLINALTSIINTSRDEARAREIAAEAGKNLAFVSQDLRNEYIDMARAERESAEANLLAADASGSANGAFETQAETTARLAEEAAVAADALKDMTEVNRTILGTIGDIQSAEEKYTETKAELAAERLEIASWDIAALDENTRKQQENEQAFRDANLAILDGLVERKLMQDGILTDDELNWLIDKREEWGIYSAAVADSARSVIAEADAITEGIANIPTQKTVTVTVNTVQMGGYTGYGGGYSYGTSDTQYNRHTAGGTFEIPMSYGVEGFRMGGGDTASGGETVSITPKGAATNDDVINAIKQSKINEKALGKAVGREVAIAIMGAG